MVTVCAFPVNFYGQLVHTQFLHGFNTVVRYGIPRKHYHLNFYKKVRKYFDLQQQYRDVNLS